MTPPGPNQTRETLLIWAGDKDTLDVFLLRIGKMMASISRGKTNAETASNLVFLVLYPCIYVLERVLAFALFIARKATGSLGSCKKNPYYTGEPT